jgi:hypothetical protein
MYRTLAGIAAASMIALASPSPSIAGGYVESDYLPDEEIDETVVVRRPPIVRETVVVRPAPVVREIVVVHPAPVVRRTVVVRPVPVVRRTVVVRPAPVVREAVVVRPLHHYARHPRWHRRHYHDW